MLVTSSVWVPAVMAAAATSPEAPVALVAEKESCGVALDRGPVESPAHAAATAMAATDPATATKRAAGIRMRLVGNIRTSDAWCVLRHQLTRELIDQRIHDTRG